MDLIQKECITLSVNNEFQKSVEVGSDTYTFRIASVKDMVEIEKKTKSAQAGLDPESVGAAYAYYNVLLSQLCVYPKDANFDMLPSFQADYLVSEVTKWLSSFRIHLGESPDSTDKGSSQQ